MSAALLDDRHESPFIADSEDLQEYARAGLKTGGYVLGAGACLACGASWAWVLDSVEVAAVLEGLEMLPGLGDALVAAVVSVSVAQVLRHRARAGF